MNHNSTITAAGATVRGPRGAVFGPLDAASDAPITLVHGSRGSGRTSFLLAAAGRMRLGGGELTVLGIDAVSDARRLRAATGVAGFDAIDGLEPAATVAETVRERLTWISPWYRRVRPLSPAQVTGVLLPAFGALDQPAPTTLVRDLAERDDLLLRIALALTERPRAVLVDDLDGVKDPLERAEVAARIDALAAQGIAFIVGSTDDRDLELFTTSTASVITLANA